MLIGDVNFDMVIQLPPGDSEDEALKDLPCAPNTGGTTGNAALALARLGIETRLVCAVGRDGHGRFISRSLAEAGVDTRHLLVTPNHDTLVMTVVVDRSGQRYFARFPAFQHAASFYPAGKLTPADIAQVGWLHSSGATFDHGTTSAAVLQAMGWARQIGIPVSFDLNLRSQSEDRFGSDFADIRQAVALSDYVLGSGTDEMSRLVGLTDPLEAARTLSDGRRTVIARAGAQGAFMIPPSGAVAHVPAFPAEVVNTLGAGDTFDAGFIAGIVAGVAPLEATRWGNALAALSIAREGAASAITRDMLQALLNADSMAG
jgi:sugar/nucleoside kinase (ribokinase family)